MNLTFRGVRGSLCRAGKDYFKYGGNTTCLELRMSDTEWLILDCGTGMHALNSELPHRASKEGLHFHVLLTHFHRDHLEGLPFFMPLYDPACSFTFYGFPWADMGVRQVLEEGIRPPWFPLNVGGTASSKDYIDLSGDPLRIGGVEVSMTRLNHPQGSTAYRLDHGGRAVVFATDIEHGDPESDARLVELSSGVDVLIHDAQYTPAEYDLHRGHGHSTWTGALQAARDCGAKNLVLFHHDPNRSDTELDDIVRQARATFPHVEAAREGNSLLI